MKIFFLQFILTTKCNQTCEYCNVYNFNKNQTKLEIDLDFLKYILTLIPNNTMIEFGGGEPGLLSNLDEAFKLVYDNSKVTDIQIMSNGLVRLNSYDWLTKENVWYNEHLIYEIDNKHINKFYDLEFIENLRWQYVVVTTQTAIQSLLLNYEYYKDLGLFRKIFWYKLMVPKVKGILSFIDELEIFFNLLKKEKIHDYIDFTLNCINTIKGLNNNSIPLRRLCAINCSRPTIDFETKQLVHCGAYFKNSVRYNLTDDIFQKHLNCDLFKYEDYCKDCYIIMGQGATSIISCKKGERYNAIK